MDVCRICQGGPNFWDFERVACREASCGVAMRVLGGGGAGFGCMLPRKMVHFGAYFHNFLLKKGAIYNVKYSLFTQESVKY